MSYVEYYNGKNFGLSTEVWVKHFAGPKLCSRGRTLGAITSQKCCHIGSFGGDVRWTLAFSVKAESTDFGHLCIFIGPNQCWTGIASFAWYRILV